MYIGLVQTPGVFASVTGSQLTPQIVLWRMVLRLKLSKPELYLKDSEKHKKSPYSKNPKKRRAEVALVCGYSTSDSHPT